MTFGAKVKLCRTIRGLTQEEFADKLGLTKQVVSLYEKNERIPKVPAAAKIADALGVPLIYLIKQSVELRRWEYDDILEDYQHGSIQQRLAIVKEYGIDPRIASDYEIISSVDWEDINAKPAGGRGGDEVTRKLLDFVATATDDELRQLIDYIAFIKSRRSGQ